MRSMSFALTEEQLLAGTKDVTRRLGWAGLKPGDRVRAVRKSMGLARGEHPVVLGVIEVVSVRRERLDAITDEDVRREGFPAMDGLEFISMFGMHMKCFPDREITRIEFRFTKEQTQMSTNVMRIAARGKGDVRVTWDPKNPEEVAIAKKTFDDLTKKKYVAWKVEPRKGEDRKDGDQIKKFDPEIGEIFISPPITGG